MKLTEPEFSALESFLDTKGIESLEAVDLNFDYLKVAALRSADALVLRKYDVQDLICNYEVQEVIDDIGFLREGMEPTESLLEILNTIGTPNANYEKLIEDLSQGILEEIESFLESGQEIEIGDEIGVDLTYTITPAAISKIYYRPQEPEFFNIISDLPKSYYDAEEFASLLRDNDIDFFGDGSSADPSEVQMLTQLWEAEEVESFIFLLESSNDSDLANAVFERLFPLVAPQFLEYEDMDFWIENNDLQDLLPEIETHLQGETLDEGPAYILTDIESLEYPISEYFDLDSRQLYNYVVERYSCTLDNLKDYLDYIFQSQNFNPSDVYEVDEFYIFIDE